MRTRCPMMPNLPAVKPRSDATHSRFAIGLFIVLLLASIAVGYSVYQRLVAEEEQQTEQTLNHIADLQSSSASSWVMERLADAAVFGSGRFLGETMDEWMRRGAPNDVTKQQVRDQLDAIRKTYSYVDVTIVDIDGNVRITTQDNDATLGPRASQTVREAILSNRTQVSSIRPASQYTHVRHVVDIATPLLNIHEEAQKVPSILVFRANADMHLGHLPSLPSLGRSVDVVLVEQRGQHIVATAASEGTPHFGDNDMLPISAAEFIEMVNEPKHFLLAKPSGQILLSVARKIDGVPWYLVAMIDQQAARANLAQHAWLVGGTCAAILSLLGLALLLWWKEKEGEYRFEVLRSETEKQQLRRRYDYLSRYANDMIILAGDNGRIIEANDKTLDVLNRKRGELSGAPLNSLFHPSGERAIGEAMEKLRHGGVAVFEVQQQVANGDLRTLEVSARAIELEGQRIAQLICRDITERLQSEAALRESQERLNAILESLLDVVWSFFPDLSRLHYINQSVEALFGYPASNFLACPRLWFECIFADDRAAVERSLKSLTPEHPLCDAEYRIVRRDGDIRWLHSRGRLILGEHGEKARIDGVTTDITQRKSVEEQVQMLAYYDNVTKLPNRALLEDRLGQAMHMATRSNKKVALLFMDLDNFKNINDSLGHHVGDMLLRAIADRLLQCVREEDTVARIGGDEFLVVLPDIDRGAQAVSVAEKILAATAQPFSLQDVEMHTTISIGISVFPEDGQDPHELIRHADSALYEAKGHGRDNYQFFTQELNIQITRNSNIERQLRQAIDSGGLSLWYQPQIETSNGRLIGAEALLRWRRDGHDFLSPKEFIPVAEERGLIAKIGEWAMREACLQTRRWKMKGLQPVPVAVNVSPIQFQQKGFVDLVIAIIEDTQIDATFLELEITESSIMKRAPQVAELAMRLREVGVGISIDDFGTGYSSLSYLKQIPIDKIKIDRSFIADMLTDVDSDAITYAIVNLAHSLNIRVIAEGVESHAQVERLRLFGCDEVQGHYYSPAVSAQAFERFLSAGGIPEAVAELRH